MIAAKAGRILIIWKTTCSPVTIAILFDNFIRHPSLILLLVRRNENVMIEEKNCVEDDQE